MLEGYISNVCGLFLTTIYFSKIFPVLLTLPNASKNITKWFHWPKFWDAKNLPNWNKFCVNRFWCFDTSSDCVMQAKPVIPESRPWFSKGSAWFFYMQVSLFRGFTPGESPFLAVLGPYTVLYYTNAVMLCKWELMILSSVLHKQLCWMGYLYLQLFDFRSSDGSSAVHSCSLLSSKHIFGMSDAFVRPITTLLSLLATSIALRWRTKNIEFHIIRPNDGYIEAHISQFIRGNFRLW